MRQRAAILLICTIVRTCERRFRNERQDPDPHFFEFENSLIQIRYTADLQSQLAGREPVMRIRIKMIQIHHPASRFRNSDPNPT